MATYTQIASKHWANIGPMMALNSGQRRHYNITPTSFHPGAQSQRHWSNVGPIRGNIGPTLPQPSANIGTMMSAQHCFVQWPNLSDVGPTLGWCWADVEATLGQCWRSRQQTLGQCIMYGLSIFMKYGYYSAISTCAKNVKVHHRDFHIFRPYKVTTAFLPIYRSVCIIECSVISITWHCQSHTTQMQEYYTISTVALAWM